MDPWAAPLEAAGPRRVKMRPGRPGLASALVVFFIPHFWIGLGLIAMALGAIAFVFVNQPLTGQVVEHHSSLIKGSRHYTLRVGYRFEGRSGTTDVGVDSAEYAQLRDGDPFELRAASAFGNTHVVTDGHQLPQMLGAMAIAAFWNSIVGVFVWMLALRPLGRWWLVRRGVPAPGVVRAHRHISGKGAREDVVVEFALDGLAPITTTMPVTPSVWHSAGLKEGDRVTVFHHPTRPWICTVYELTSWELDALAAS